MGTIKIEIEDKRMFDILMAKFVGSSVFKRRLDQLVGERIKEISSDFFMIGYQKGLKEGSKSKKPEKWVQGKQ